MDMEMHWTLHFKHLPSESAEDDGRRGGGVVNERITPHSVEDCQLMTQPSRRPTAFIIKYSVTRLRKDIYPRIHRALRYPLTSLHERFKRK